MLKLFRTYNKYLLVILGSLLMVVFLVEGTISGLMPSAEDQVIGRINGEKILMRDQRTAGHELEILLRAMPELTLLAPREPIQWLLLVRGAQQAGLSASNEQVAALLGGSRAQGGSVQDIARQLGVTAEDLTAAFRHWLMVQQYIELNSGLAHLPLDQRIGSLHQAMQYMQMGLNNPQMLLDPARGKPRISRPLLERFLQDQQATVTVQAVALNPERELPNVGEPDAKAVEALYAEYKDELPGSSKGYGLGYKLPDRVKLEYLTIPLANARKAVSVEESQVLAYYDANQSRFIPAPPAGTTQPAAPRQPRPYLEVRDSIRSQLVDEAAHRLATRVANAALAALQDNARGLAMENGYRKIVSTWTPTPLVELSKQLEERFGVQVEVRRIQDHWLTRADLQALPALGSSYIQLGQQTLSTLDYIASARELEPSDKHPAYSLHLQVYMPSQIAQATDGSLLLFRLTDAQATHTPALADIRPQVARDAQRVEAYRKLLAQMDTWKHKSAQPLAAIASELNTTLIGPASFNRRDTFGGVSLVPQVVGIGRSEDFVDGVFNLALEQDADKRLAGDDAGLPGVIAADDRMTVYIVRMLDFQPMTKRDFDQQLAMPFSSLWLNLAMTHGLEDDPFSTENLAKRVGFKWENPARDAQAEGH